MPLLHNARLVLPTGVVDGGWLATAGAGISGIGGPHAPEPGAERPDHAGSADPATSGDPGRSGNPPAPADPADRIDLGGHYVVPGFVDLHVHGGGGGAFSSGQAAQARTAAAFHLSHGTTTIMASTVTGELADLERYVAELAELVQDGELAGVHLEGPFISKARCGAHNPELLRAPEPAAIRRLLKAGKGTVRMITLAPELEHGITATGLLADAGVIAAIGHTDATYAQANLAIARGARVATHIFNAMRPVHHREPGPVTAALEQEDVIVELVNDGLHVHPAVAGLVFATAGAHRTALITDAMSAAGSADGIYTLGTLAVEVSGGVARVANTETIAGSTLTMDDALRNAVHSVGVPIEDAVVSASLTPARALGLADRIGSLEVGKQADLCVLNEDLRVTAVMRRGRWVHGMGATAFSPLLAH